MNWLKNIKQKFLAEKQTQTKHTYAEAQVITRRQMIGSAILIAVIGIFLALCFDTKPRSIAEKSSAVPVVEEVVAQTENKTDTIGQIINELPQPAEEVTSGSELDFSNIFADESAAPAKPANETTAPVAVAATSPSVAATEVTPNNVQQANQAAEKAAQEKQRQQKIAQEKAAQEKQRQQKIAQEKAAQEKQRQQKLAREKAAQEKQRQQKIAQEKARAQAANTQKYVIQVGAFSDPIKASQMQARVQKLGVKVSLQKVTQNGQTIIKVRTAPYNSQPEAVKQAEKLIKQGIETSILPLK